MLGRFSTDAYDAMLMPSRPGGYRTPRFWLLLTTQLLPHISPQMGAQLIAKGPRDPAAAQTVERLAAWLTRTRRVTSWLQKRSPTLYSLAARILARLSPSRPRSLPGGMPP
jgi:hypothetical protein